MRTLRALMAVYTLLENKNGIFLKKPVVGNSCGKNSVNI